MLRVNQLSSFGKRRSSVLSTLSQVLSATSSSTTITAPSGIQAGDLLVLLDRADNLSLPSTVVPTGFTSIANVNNGSGMRQIVSYKLATGSEGGASITGMAGGLDVNKALAVFRGNVPIASISVASLNAPAPTDANPTAQNVTAAGGTVPLIVFGCYSATNTIVSPRTFTPAKDGELNPSPSQTLYLAWKIYNSAPANVSVDMDDEGSANTLASFYLQAA